MADNEKVENSDALDDDLELASSDTDDVAGGVMRGDVVKPRVEKSRTEHRP